MEHLIETIFVIVVKNFSLSKSFRISFTLPILCKLQ